MYEKHFHLRERPFALSPDPDYLYPSRVHKEALGYLRYGIEGHAGFVVITGEIGSGKTTMLQSLLGRLDRNTAVARIVNTMLEPRELLEAIMLDFGLDPTGLGKPAMLHRLADFLVRQRQAGRLTLLVIDEAQNLTLPALEEIRMLSNLETEKSKLIQIILVGQPELREKLRLPQLEQLRQRITVSYHLQPLDADETARYVNHRLKRAAVGAPLEFPLDVTELIHRRSGGVPRIINVIADATLLFAYGLDRREVDVPITEEALAELDATGVLASYQTEGARAAAASAVSVAETQEALRFTDEMRQRERLMAERERDLLEREQAISRQQRVLEEQARLLAAAQSSGVTRTATTPAVAGATPTGRATARAAGSAAGAPAPARTAVPPAPAAAAAARTAPAAAATPRSAVATAPLHPPPARPALKPAAGVSAGAPRVTPGIQVQPYRQSMAVAPLGFWGKVRRVLFGTAEREAGA